PQPPPAAGPHPHAHTHHRTLLTQTLIGCSGSSGRPDAVGYGDRGLRLELAYRELVHPRTPPEHLTSPPLTPVEAELARILTDHR
ncbi:hypothetical protein ACFUEJ_20570, partial [Gordonia sp. NPDC057258]|uniref:hypothetical protein n=1 Tax=unclassified Gordonia (in: high G+C Gram-positive bacteria) TaxID=2657482 RepID=UPI003633EB49